MSFYLFQGPLALVLTSFCAVAALLAAIVDRSGRATRRIAGWWSRALLRLLRVRVEVSGQEDLPRGPAVYAANHSSTLDIFVVFGWLPVDFRIVFKQSVGFIPILGWSIWLAGHVPIDRRHPFRARKSLERAARRIASGTSVVLFPEGTRSPDGRVLRFRRGSFRLAIEAGVPVVPVSIVGVKALVPEGIPSVRPGTVRLVLHPPVPSAGRVVDEVDTFAGEVRAIVARGCGPEEEALA
ncbi:MAG: lysophospholipid acyltransferase family protein [Vicinamibacteria bacterium]